MNENKNLQYDWTLFPNLLSLEELKTCIQEKFPKLRNFIKMTQEEAVGIYYQMLLPRSQRQYPANSRGRRLQDKRRRTGLQAPSTPSFSNVVDSSLSRKRQNSSTSSPLDRLKPPPETGVKTKIRISSSSNTKTSSAESLVINRHRSVSSSSDETSPKKSSKRNDPPASQNDSQTKPKKVKITWP